MVARVRFIVKLLVSLRFVEEEAGHGSGGFAPCLVTQAGVSGSIHLQEKRVNVRGNICRDAKFGKAAKFRKGVANKIEVWATS
jgi:hypothetical protein